MSFKRDNFAPAFISGTKTIRLFVYTSDDDLLDEIMATGYFNSQRIMLHKNSMIDVIAKDHVARLIVGPQEGLNVTIRSEHFRATDPYVDQKSKGEKMAARARAAKIKKKDELAKTG